MNRQQEINACLLVAYKTRNLYKCSHIDKSVGWNLFIGIQPTYLAEWKWFQHCLILESTNDCSIDNEAVLMATGLDR